MAQYPLTALADIPARRTNWLFEPYLARGRLAVLDGDPGVGKSFFAIDLAARLSRGQPLPNGQAPAQPANTIYFTTEDRADDVIRPRAEAAGADLRRIFVETPGRFGPLLSFPRDAERLWRYIYELQAAFVVFDPIVAFLQTGVSANIDASIRKALTPLAYVAAHSLAAMLLHRHLNKAAGPRALYRGLGSIGITAACRSQLLLAEHPDDPDLRVLAHAKSNGPIGPSLGFRVRPDEQGNHRVEWAGPVDLSADELCACPRPIALRPRDRAADWLREQLAGGPRKAVDVIAHAAKAGIAERTLDRARKDLGIVSERVLGCGQASGWIWSDPSVNGTCQPVLERPVELPDLGLDGSQSLDELLDRLRERQ